MHRVRREQWRVPAEHRAVVLRQEAAVRAGHVREQHGAAGSRALRHVRGRAFLKHCESLRKEGKKLIITGDVNTAHKAVDLKNPKPNEKNSGFLPKERAWMDKFIGHGYIDTFREFCQDPDHYTWWSYRSDVRKRNIGWRIDYFFVTEDLIKKVENSRIYPEVMGSDHCPIGLNIKSL